MGKDFYRFRLLQEGHKLSGNRRKLIIKKKKKKKRAYY